MTLETRPLAAHILVTLSQAQADGRSVRLDELAMLTGVRRADVRRVVTSLHLEGHVDALRLRLTLSGLALATALGSCDLRSTRRAVEPKIRRVA
ncbi:MAG: hypothetical protein JWP97_3419 [Labilithrix sp.]|nr:hypothetical protein [Labilithrix sp.]